MDDQLIQLEKEYCPPIDTSLLFAIILDYDLSDLNSCDKLRITLNALKESALVEESSVFDPSGSSGLLQDGLAFEDSSELARSCHGDLGSNSGTTEDTELTGVSQRSGRIKLDSLRQEQSVEGSEQAADNEALSVEQKCAVLQEMFPTAKDFDIKFTLKKAHNNFSKAVEELLNQAFLDSEDKDDEGPSARRGVEGFYASSTTSRGRRKKGKKRQLLRRTSSMTDALAADSSGASSPSDRWNQGRRDVEFITQRSFLSSQVITSTYHKSGASLPATIAALCNSKDLDSNPYITPDLQTTLEAHTIELAVKFPPLAYDQVGALIRLTHPSTASAQELAHALVSFRHSNTAATIIPQYRPRAPSPTDTPAFGAPSQSLGSPTPGALSATRNAAFTQAHTAYRKSNAKNNLGAAAAYYSALGRDASASLRAHEAAAADELVTRQSRAGEVDLHGANVRDAVRIAREKVNGWWEREGREWARRGTARGEPLRIVTGQGRHSEGGRGRLGPAVVGMLMREGWNVKVGQGSVDVVGRVRGG